MLLQGSFQIAHHYYDNISEIELHPLPVPGAVIMLLEHKPHKKRQGKMKKTFRDWMGQKIV